MKKLISYSILFVTLLVSLATFSVYVWEKNVKIQAVADNAEPLHSENDYFFADFESLCIPTGINRLNNGRVQQVIVKTDDNLHSLQANYFSRLANQQLYTTKSIYFSFYAEKQLWGYYLFALRKLLI